MSEKLRFFDPQLKEKPEIELFNEPEWLIHLRQLDGQIKVKKTRNVCFPSAFRQVQSENTLFSDGAD